MTIVISTAALGQPHISPSFTPPEQILLIIRLHRHRPDGSALVRAVDDLLLHLLDVAIEHLGTLVPRDRPNLPVAQFAVAQLGQAAPPIGPLTTKARALSNGLPKKRISAG